MIRFGVIGISEGNGHPFSFSAIINGYSDDGMAKAGWPFIYSYLKRRDPSEFGFNNCRVTHAWTQDAEITRQLCAASQIPHAVSDPGEMIGQVDAIILARDDYDNHFKMGMPFLKAGLHVFIDKPLSLDIDELRRFRPYLETGKLFSCSAMRFARELDEPRSAIEEYGTIRLVRGAILNYWENYGVQMVEAILNTIRSQPMSIRAMECNHDSFAIRMNDRSLLQIDTLGDIGRCFRVDLFGTRKITSHEIVDNFSMFRRMLWHFMQSINSGLPSIDPEHTLDVMRLLIAGRKSRKEKTEVFLNEIII